MVHKVFKALLVMWGVAALFYMYEAFMKFIMKSNSAAGFFGFFIVAFIVMLPGIPIAVIAAITRPKN